MGLLQKAVETYDCSLPLVGVYKGNAEPLAPIAHTLTSANIEISLDRNGMFQNARVVDKTEPKIIFPVTEDSSGRTSKPAAHPLCDQLKYLASKNQELNQLYISGLKAWAESDFSHPMLGVILHYIESGSIIADLVKSGILDVDEKGAYDEKLMICWRVNGFEEEPACWKNQNLFRSYASYYCSLITERNNALCMIEGKIVPKAEQHPKGIIPIKGNAKLISANDNNGFTFRGRFINDTQAATVGYEASQKAHNALRWVISQQGVFAGGRSFICWNPQGKVLPKPMNGLRRNNSEPKTIPSDYKEELRNTLFSFKQNAQLKGTESAVIAAFDAATTGRLALAYYNELSVADFLQRMHDWDSYCCWYTGPYGIQPPSLLQIVDCAFGTPRNAFLETDDGIQRQHVQRLLDCKINGGCFPADIVKAITQRASNPLAYEENTWRRILQTACAVLQKYRHDTNQGGNEMSWELDKKDRSFQYGRLLAVMDRAEADFYYKTQETRQTNAIKSMSEYRRRPWTVYERINRQLHNAYLNRIDPWQSNRYEKLSGEICAILFNFPENELNKPLSDTYLVGYELQRNSFFTKNDTTETED